MALDAGHGYVAEADRVPRHVRSPSTKAELWIAAQSKFMVHRTISWLCLLPTWCSFSDA